MFPLDFSLKSRSGVHIGGQCLKDSSPDENGKNPEKGKGSKDAAVDEDFKFIVRMVNTDLDGEKPLLVGLTSIKGIGLRSAHAIVKLSELDPRAKIGNLDDDSIAKLEDIILGFSDQVPLWMVNRKKDWESGENLHLVGVDIDLTHRDDINRMKMIRCYRGIRHEDGQKVRGQRTKSNGRTGLQMGVIRKKGVPGQTQQSKR